MPDREDSEGYPPFEDERPEPARGPLRPPARSVAEELRALDERLAAAEDARAVEGEELLTRMMAIEVLIDHLGGRVVELERDARGPRDIPEGLELRIGGLEYAADALGPLTAVPATIAALEQELIALGERLDARDAREEIRDSLVRREIEARVSLAESRLGTRYAERWESLQDSIEAADDARGRLEERLASQAQAASSALAELEERVNASVEVLAARLATATGASGELAQSTVARLESLERDIASIETEFELLAGRISRAPVITTKPEADADAPESREEPVLDSAPEPAHPAGPDRARAALPSDPTGPVNLNDASFEVLRSLGCSVTQTARILAARKVRGGFGSPEDLAEVPGLPKEFRTELISRLTV